MATAPRVIISHKRRFGVPCVPRAVQASAEEVEAWFQKEQDGPTPDGLFDREDADKDGSISWEEFSGPKGDEPPTDV